MNGWHHHELMDPALCTHTVKNALLVPIASCERRLASSCPFTCCSQFAISHAVDLLTSTGNVFFCLFPLPYPLPSQLLLITGANRAIGIDDHFFALGDSLVLTVLGQVRGAGQSRDSPTCDVCSAVDDVFYALHAFNIALQSLSSSFPYNSCLVVAL